MPRSSTLIAVPHPAPRHHRRSEQGAILVLTSVFVIAAMSLAGLAVDVGHARAERARYQAAADAAALLATYRINSGATPDQASAEAKALVRMNLGLADAAWSGCTDAKRLPDSAPVDSAASNQCISFVLNPPAGQQRGARVRLPMQQIRPLLGLGLTSIDVTAVAGADGDAGACDIFDPASCATTTSTTAPPTTTTAKPTTTTAKPPTTTAKPPTTTVKPPTTTAKPPTTTVKPPTTTAKPPTTTVKPPTTTAKPPTTTVKPPTTTVKPTTTTAKPPTTTIDISF